MNEINQSKQNTFLLFGQSMEIWLIISAFWSIVGIFTEVIMTDLQIEKCYLKKEIFLRHLQ